MSALRIERTIAGPIQLVFDAWTSAEALRRWWHAEHDWETPRAEVDLRVGGTIAATMRNPHDGTEYGGRGEFTVVQPPERLAFRWTWDDGAEAELIEVEFHEREGGEATTVVLMHHGLRPDAREEFREGWNNSLDNLDRTLAR
jgi:uncharacterized protein YndB with AHSA1/START domain